jgi:hypothetical protein
MPDKFARVRTRIDPPVKKGLLVLGKKYPWNTNIGGWHPSPNATFTHNFNLPFIRAMTMGDELHPGPPYRTGGPMKSLKAERVSPYEIQGEGTYLRQVDANPAAWEKYVGGFAPPSEVQFGGEVEMSNSNNLLNLNSVHFPELSGYGSQAWVKTKPRLEQVSALVFAAELRDLPRMLRNLKRRAKELHHEWWDAKARTHVLKGDFDNNEVFMSPKRAADYFLEHSFGWAPFLSDLRKFYTLWHGKETIIKRLSSQNGQPVRRKATLVGLPVEVPGPDGKPIIRYEPTIEDWKLNGGSGQLIQPPLHSNFYATTPSWELRRVTKLKVSATGRFSFYRPEFDTSKNEYNSSWFEINRLMTIYGLRISPSNIYRATPWTWLIDWFSNLGDHFDYLTDITTDSIAAEYLYLHVEKEIVWKFIQTLPFRDPGLTTLTWERKLLVNERKGANSPYGFNLSWDNLTPRQLVILGALGITRSKPAGGL